MELRLSQPPPEPSPFDGDPAKYLRLRANFRDQVESKKSLSDSERLNYLMSYTTGRAKAVIENYNGLPNGCQLALKVLEHRFGQSAMIVQALKSSVTDGPKIRPGDNAALLALSDKTENCCWAMSELRSCEHVMCHVKKETKILKYARSNSRSAQRAKDVRPSQCITPCQ